MCLIGRSFHVGGDVLRRFSHRISRGKVATLPVDASGEARGRGDA